MKDGQEETEAGKTEETEQPSETEPLKPGDEATTSESEPEEPGPEESEPEESEPAATPAEKPKKAVRRASSAKGTGITRQKNS